MSDPSAETYNPQGGWFASALFVLVFLYFWIGLDPLPNPASSAQLAAYGESSNAFNQLIVLGMSGLVLAMLFLHPARDLAIRAYGPLALVFFWIVLTIFFSDTPDAALRRTIYSALVILSASAVLLLPRDNAQFARLVGICICLAVALSYFGVVFMPARAIHQATDAAEAALAGDWRGHFGHKNTAAAAMAFAVFFGLYLLRMKMFWSGLALTVLAAFFLLSSGGKTSAAMLPAVLVAVWLFERLGMFRLLLVGGGLFLVNFVILSVAVFPEINAFVTGLGIDATFTDRTSIWELAVSAIGSRPLTGYGFQSFWQTDALFYGNASASTWAVTAANAHNAYLDQLINGGWPLLILVLIWLVVLPCRHASVALARGSDKDLTRLYLRIWLFGLFTSCFESPFFENSGPIWFTMLIAVFGLRLQAHADLVEKPQIAPGDLRAALS
ncbi:O-antigen ligase [Devosia sp.]|uniref:O-antigen ligase family protein n=1 Tax=Devosia sp. TaxID=1871048 RepID=UPI001B27E7ED|nr:O-antigen ligase [Devosia sp.]MBO9588867.1 O-antigen ligase family protein [Devosia sp.]